MVKERPDTLISRDELAELLELAERCALTAYISHVTLCPVGMCQPRIAAHRMLPTPEYTPCPIGRRLGADVERAQALRARVADHPDFAE